MTERLWRAALWLLIAVAASVVFGILNDQVTITISPEYFTVFKRAQFAPFLEMTGTVDSPARVQAVVVGTFATWWFGLILGALLAHAGLRGKAPAVPTRRFVQAVGVAMGVTVGLSVLFGAAGYLVGSSINLDADHWPFLWGIHDVRHAFTVGAWHDGAYLGGALGTLAEYWRIRRERRATEAEA